MPAIGAFRAQLGFNENTLHFNTFEGELGGGKFKLGGSIQLAKLTEPVFDLHLQSDEVLVMRNDSMTVRADADVTLNGPLAAANVGGTVFVTHSRFFKEIDILPISLPGRAKPAPKTARAMDTGVSFPQPPLRDWKFDLAIKTETEGLVFSSAAISPTAPPPSTSGSRAPASRPTSKAPCGSRNSRPRCRSAP